MQVISRPERLDNGDVVWDGVNLDISDRKTAELALQDAQAQFHRMTENVPGMMYRYVRHTDGHDQLTYVSSPLREMYELEPETVLEDVANLWQRVHPDDISWLQTAIHTSATTLQPFQVEHRMILPQKGLRWIQTISQPHRLDNGNIVWDGVAIDITERKHTELALQESQAQFRYMTENVPGMIYRYVLHPDGNDELTYVSSQLREIFELEPETGLQDASSLWHRIHPDDLSIIEYDVQVSAETLQPFTSAYRLILPQKGIRWVQNMSRVERLDNGDVVWDGIVIDISDRKQAQLALEQEVLRRITIFDTSSDGIHILDIEGNLLEANASFYRTLGYTPEEAKHLNVGDWDAKKTRKEIQANFQKHLSNPSKVRTIETLHQRKDGTIFPVEISICAMEWNGQISFVCISRDISERKQAEEQLQRTLTQLQTSNNELESFAYSISHDLRAPLRAINGFSQALLDDYSGQFDDDGQYYFQRIQANTNRMGELIDDLLNLSRVSRSELHYTTIDLSALVQEIIHDLQAAEPERQVEIVTASELTVFADATLMRVVLMNLLQNAWKFTSHHPTARIEFGVLTPDSPQASAETTYFVKDDGAGFDIAYHHKLFGIFQRLHSTEEFSGTGIGLATVQRAIHRHGGRVWAEAAIEAGATFFFTIPSAAFRALINGSFQQSS